MNAKGPRSVKNWLRDIFWFLIVFLCIGLGFSALSEPHISGKFSLPILACGGFLAIAVLIRSTCLRHRGKHPEKHPVSSALGVFALSVFLALLLWVVEKIRDAV